MFGLNDTAFLLYLEQDYLYMLLYNMLSVSFKEWIASKEVELVQWTPQYRSDRRCNCAVLDGIYIH